MSKTERIVFAILIILVFGFGGFFIGKSNGERLKPLPKQEKSEGLRGDYGIDKNINDQTIDNYLGRSDVAYRDLRMLDDPATWENKGGERKLTGFIEGFEVIPYAYLTEFPEAYVEQKRQENVSGLYSGPTLFHLDEEGNYVANYKESMDILEYLFPKDKTIFLICGAGGYANFAKQMLIALGWDEEKIYNIGGYWFYEGDHAVSTVNPYDENKFDFWKVNYHNIDFDNLTPIEE